MSPPSVKRRRRRGYTLIEMIVATSSATLLMTGLASALAIATSAFRLDTGTQAQKGTAAQVQADLMFDLQHALSFSERTATAVTFTVPDRNHDGNPETIRYAWSGTPGDPLTYAYNGGTAVNIAEDVESFDLSYLTRVMAAAGANGPENVLFVVTNASSPTAQEQLRITQLTDWGYAVELLTASSSQSAYDTAIANNDVAYVCEEAVSTDIGTKLRDSSIGVVNGEPALVDELGVSSGYSTPTFEDTDITDNAHYITEDFDIGSERIFDSDQQGIAITGTLASGLQTLSEVDDEGTNRPGLAVLDVGAALYGGGTTPARRVQLPFGSYEFDFAELNADGLTLLKRSIDWAGSNDATVLPRVLFVVTDSTAITSEESLRSAQLSSWGFTVNMINDGASQAAYDAAVAVNDVVYYSEEIDSGTLSTKVRNAPIGVVSGEPYMIDEAGFASDFTLPTTDQIDIINGAHYITSEFGTGSLTILSSAEEGQCSSGTIAGGLTPLAEIDDSGTDRPALAIVNFGGSLYGGGTAAGRRVQLPWGGSGFSFSALNSDGLTLLKRSLEWAAGAN